MSNYYLHDGQNQIGPFTADALKERNISKETYVWKEGLNDWQKAGELAELDYLFTNVPPPFMADLHKNNVSSPPSYTAIPIEKGRSWISRNPIRSSVLVIVILVIVAFVYNIQASNSDLNSMISHAINKSPAELRNELAEKERQNPTDYLTSEITMRENFIGQKVFEGTISNSASIASFKDVQLEITYLSNTKSIIASEKFIIYEVVGPQHTIDIQKIKTKAPKATDSFSIMIIGAEKV